MAKIFLDFFVFSFIFSSCVFMSKSFLSSDSDKKADRTTVRSEKSIFKFKTVKSSWLAKHPAIYKEFKKLVESQKKEIRSNAEKTKKEFPNSALLPYILSIESIKEFNKEDLNIISVRASIYTYTGGSHGMLYHVSWNWDKEKEKFISLDKHVKTPRQFKKLQDDIRKTLFKTTKPGLLNKDLVNRAISEIKNLRIWNIDNNNIVFMFDPYEIASYAAGAIEVTVPIP